MEDPWAVIETERRAFADLLEGLTPAQWTTPSLCAEWSVQEVATHMMVGPTGSLGGFLTAMIAGRGKFDRANRVLVDRRMSRPTSAIIADFRDYADHRFTPPGLDWRAPLSDLLIHRLDVAVPLGIDHGRPLEPWREVLSFIVSPQARTGFVKAGVPALRFVGTDLDWTHGEGDAVEGPVEVLALALTGRSSRLDELVGPGADRLRAWVDD